MKRIILMIALLPFVSCQESEEVPNINTSPQYSYHTVLIEGCEYLENNMYNSYALTHKGNCKNHGKIVDTSELIGGEASGCQSKLYKANKYKTVVAHKGRNVDTGYIQNNVYGDNNITIE